MGTTLQEELNEEKKSFVKPITGDLAALLVICHRSSPLGLTKTKLVSFAKIFQEELLKLQVIKTYTFLLLDLPNP